MENTVKTTTSNLSLNNRAALSITGVKKIKSTEPACVIAVLDNCTIIINGSNLSVQNVSIASGILDINGTVSSIKYTNTVSRKFSLRNMFK